MNRCLVFAATLLGLCFAAPAAAQWRVAESANFRVYGDMSEAALRDRTALLEDYREMLSTFTSAPAIEDQPKLDIYIVDNISQAVPFGKINPNVGGFYSASDNAIIAFATNGEYGQSTLLHEYAHHYMFGSGAIVYPAWYVEGFAEYFATARFQPGRIEFGLDATNRSNNLIYLTWLPWNKIVDANFRYRGSEQAAMFYAQSWLLTHYLFRVPGMAPKLQAYLRGVAGGEDSLGAFRTHVEPELDKLGTRLRGYLVGRGFTFSRFKRPPQAPASVTVTLLPASAGRLLLLMASMEHRGRDVKDRAAALAKVRDAAKDFPGDALAQRALAQAELRFGTAADAGPRIDGLLAAAPADATLLRWKAETLLAQKDGRSPENTAAVRRLLVRATKAEPGDWRAMHIYMHTFDLEHAPLKDSQFAVLQRMFELAPQVDGIAIDMASGLMQSGLHAQAATVLSSVAFSPHESGYTRLARALRDRAVAKDTPGYVAQLDKGPPPPEPEADGKK
ncbi:DUF1570 domain-containing protein [Sandarakinorhabdus sp.]|uniref:DUF1570 domain-containing protein n=1 Tax=Sandarakinorhabdus sp. TaxID=1916663 RepID=UPI00286D7563|nr:DUF1570 domain-containing protein [Sandarakinorhabdus sp.]